MWDRAKHPAWPPASARVGAPVQLLAKPAVLFPRRLFNSSWVTSHAAGEKNSHSKNTSILFIPPSVTAS